jgi:hypothetical protein
MTALCQEGWYRPIIVLVLARKRWHIDVMRDCLPLGGGAALARARPPREFRPQHQPDPKMSQQTAPGNTQRDAFIPGFDRLHPVVELAKLLGRSREPPAFGRSRRTSVEAKFASGKNPYARLSSGTSAASSREGVGRGSTTGFFSGM